MRQIRSMLYAGIATASALAAVGCGGGGAGDDGGAPPPSQGIDRGGSAFAQGAITGFGSVFVNGVRYSTSGASITIDDSPGVESDLAVGQVVRIEGTLDAGGTTGTARSIVYDSDVKGQIASIDTIASTLVVLGQTIRVTTGTSFDSTIVPGSLAGLAIGDTIEVSGFPGSAGVLTATRIERMAAGGELEVRGIASNVDTAAQRLRINDLTVDYSNAMLEHFPSGQPAEGDLVEAKGALGGSGDLLATRIERESASLPGSTDDTAEIEGLVTRFASSADFDVAGQRVTTTVSTRYEGGASADLAVDVYIEVDGDFDATGRLVAREVDFRRSAEVEIAAPVDTVDAAANSLRLLGIVVLTDSLTRFEDQSDLDIERFSLADLRAGDYVEVRAYADGDNLIANRLERDDAEPDVVLRGQVEAVAQPELDILGVRVVTSAATEFRDENDLPITQAQFFAAVDGRTVKITGQYIGGAIQAEEAELED